LELSEHHLLFVGFKLDGSLKHQLRSLSGPDAKYVSTDGSAFLRLCTREKDIYVGKVISDRLTTDRVEDVRRNVLSIITRLCPDTRLPTKLEIWACESEALVGEQKEL
jgi:hypothetical protein